MGFFKSIARAVRRVAAPVLGTTAGRVGAGILSGGLTELNRPALLAVSNAIGGFSGGTAPGTVGGITSGEVDAASRKHFGAGPLIGGLSFEDILGFTKDDPNIKDPLERRIKRIEGFEESTKAQLAKLTTLGRKPERDEEDRLKFDQSGTLLSTRQKFRRGFGSPSTTGTRRAFG